MNYFRDARLRAQRKKSLWNLLTFTLTILVGGGAAWSYGRFVTWVHELRFVGGSTMMESRGPYVPIGILGAILFIFPIAFFGANLVVYLIPPVRRVLEAEAATTPGTSYVEAQRGLWRLMRWMVPGGLLLGAVSGLLQWHS